MRDNYDFSDGVVGKYYQPDEDIKVPIYLNSDNYNYFLRLALDKNMSLSELINRFLDVSRVKNGLDMDENKIVPKTGKEQQQIKIGNAIVDLDKETAECQSEELSLTHDEIGIIRILNEHRGEVVPFEKMREIWSGDVTLTVEEKVIKIVPSINKKLCKPDSKEIIETIPNRGLKLIGV